MILNKPIIVVIGWEKVNKLKKYFFEKIEYKIQF